MKAFDENLSTLKRMIHAPLIGDIAHADTDRGNSNQTLRAARLAASQLSTEILVPVHPKD
jgi:hypothetical protein